MYLSKSQSVFLQTLQTLSVRLNRSNMHSSDSISKSGIHMSFFTLKTYFSKKLEKLNQRMVWAFGCSANIHSFWDAKSFIRAIVHRKKFTKATFSWLTNNVAEVAVSIDGEDKKYEAGDWVYCCVAPFYFMIHRFRAKPQRLTICQFYGQCRDCRSLGGT